MEQSVEDSLNSNFETKAFCGGLEEVSEGNDDAYLKSPGCDVSPAAKDPHGRKPRKGEDVCFNDLPVSFPHYHNRSGGAVVPIALALSKRSCCQR